MDLNYKQLSPSLRNLQVLCRSLYLDRKFFSFSFSRLVAIPTDIHYQTVLWYLDPERGKLSRSLSAFDNYWLNILRPRFLRAHQATLPLISLPIVFGDTWAQMNSSDFTPHLDLRIRSQMIFVPTRSHTRMAILVFRRWITSKISKSSFPRAFPLPFSPVLEWLVAISRIFSLTKQGKLQSPKRSFLSRCWLTARLTSSFRVTQNNLDQ